MFSHRKYWSSFALSLSCVKYDIGKLFCRNGRFNWNQLQSSEDSDRTWTYFWRLN